MAVDRAPAGVSGVTTDVEIPAQDPGRFREAVGDVAYSRFDAAVERARSLLDGRVVWNVNTTARGGGVAEMLRPLLGYVRGAGFDARWTVVNGDEAFFRVTKRIHHRLHGSIGDGGPLDAEARRTYDSVLEDAAEELCPRVRSGDVVMLHDPQTIGLCAPLRECGAVVVWRCHVGTDKPNEVVREAWRFLIDDVKCASSAVFSREAFIWEGLDRDRVAVVPPSIDAFAPKNEVLDGAAVVAILHKAGILAGEASGGMPQFQHADGSTGRVDHRATLVGDPLPEVAPAVVQVSRWDPLKDPVGVVTGFAEHVAPGHPEAHLAVVGPDVTAVSDDPEGAQTLEEVTAAWRRLPDAVRARVTLISLPMDDPDQNAVMVNALQRHAAVVVQKSLAEGFGLTVAEAMWKARPVVASRVGGIQDQVVDGQSGLLLDDPRDLRAFGAAVSRLLDDKEAAQRMGASAHERVREDFLGPRHLAQYVDLVARLI